MKLAITTLLAVLPLVAQNGSVQGIVTDAQGGAIADAVVSITNVDTSLVRKTVTNATGEYSLLQVIPGKYRIAGVKPGFRTAETTALVQTDTPLTINVKLEVGQVTETVKVEGEAVTVNTENATVGTPFTTTQVNQLPLQTRNIVSLLSIEPGVSSGGQVVGARSDQNNVLLDGADVNDNFGGGGFNSNLPIPLDSVQEFRTTVAGLNADAGFTSGGQVSIITKGGTNMFHGSAYEYNRNTLTSANSWSNNRANIPRAALVRNQYGASIGGPILKNRVFFFFNYEARKDRSASSVNSTVPSDSFRQGNLKVLLKDGRTITLTPQDIANIDPLHLGESSYIQSWLGQYPSGNNPLLASDKGLNYNTLTFNTPNHLDNHVMVGRMDYNIDSAGKHSIMLRGTLNGAANDSSLAQFPGQSAASRALDNSRGLAARYTWVITPHLVNNLTYGYTRASSSQTGNQIIQPSLGLTNFLQTPRGSQHFEPTTSINDDLNYTRARHTMQFGMSLHFAQTVSNNFSNLPSYSFNRNTLLNLGGDIQTDVLAYLQPTYGSSIALSSGTNVTNAFGTMLGIVNNLSATYHFTVAGQPIPFGTPIITAFNANESEMYAQDSFKWKRNFTITYGLRYSLSGVPYESNGVEVTPTVPWTQFFAERVGAQAAGIPGYALPDAMITYGLAGPKHNAAGYYPMDKTNFSPRLAIAYSPEENSLLGKIAGKGSVIRLGASMQYDHYGTSMASAFASSGSPGLATGVQQAVNTNFTTSQRYAGTSLPTLPTAQGGSFPFTPPAVTGGFTTYTGVANDLKAPYQYLLNANYARPLPHRLTLELGYLGRLSHSAIVTQDYAQPLTKFVDTKSGQTWLQASTVMAQIYDAMGAGVTPTTAANAIKANPSLIPKQSFFENEFPGMTNHYITGSASANYFYDLFGNYSGSDLDTLNDMDRIRLSNGTCLSITGCNTFYALQDSGVEAYVNAGKAAYHAGTAVLRRVVQNGWGFDFNYTLSHALDNGSSNGTALQDAFNPNAYRGPADFDARHTVSIDAVLELPIGRGKMLFNKIPGWLDQVVGGWQVAPLATFRSGTPLSVGVGGIYNVNYEYGALAILRPGASLPANGLTVDQNGIPSIFPNTNAVDSFVTQYPGTVGSRGILRGVNSFNVDLAASKYFHLPKEGWRLQLRAEAFNLENRVNFGGPSLSTASPTLFGEITTAGAARVMQFAGRLEF